MKVIERHGKPTYEQFVMEDSRMYARAYLERNPDMPGDLEHAWEKCSDFLWRVTVDGKSQRTILSEIGVNPDDYLEAPSIPPIDIEKLKKQPRYGLSIASLVVNHGHNIPEVIKRFVDAGANSTRINLLTALWDGPEAHLLPFTQTPDGKWDLYNWNTEYFDKLQFVKESMNAAGINIQWTNYELYSWSDRKAGDHQENTPWRHNVNGVYWRADDTTLTQILPDAWSKEWFKKVCPLLDLHYNVFEIGNELPEKGLHERVRDAVRAIVPSALIQVNRNEDTPGQYRNMKIGENYDFLALHGRKLNSVDDLDDIYHNTSPRNFQEFVEDFDHDKWRVIFSSDGARINKDSDLGITETYDWNKLGRFFDNMSDEGYSVEHQSRAKMTPAPSHHMIEVDWFKDRVI